MLYIISLMNIILSIIFICISYKIDGKGNVGLCILILGILYSKILLIEGGIPNLYNSYIFKFSAIIGMVMFPVYGLTTTYLRNKIKSNNHK